MGFDIKKSIIAYHRNNSDNGYGLAWDIFWDYQCENPLDKQNDLREYSTQLFCYLCCFGMARGSTRLAYSNLDKFTRFLEDSKDILSDLSQFKFEELKPHFKEEYCKNINKLKSKLDNYKISSSNTMLSKIIMGISGECVAIDTFFKYTYNYYYDGDNPNDIYNTLLKLKESYNDLWRSRIEELDDKYRKTRRGKDNLIPIPRLIDMAFWWYGSE